MYVNVTPEQYNYVRQALLIADITGDAKPVIGALAIFTLGNGGDFNPAVARVLETRLVVIPAPKKAQ